MTTKKTSGQNGLYLSEVCRQYFAGWNISNVKVFDEFLGRLDLSYNGTCLRVFFHMNGAKGWTDERVMVDHFEALEKP